MQQVGKRGVSFPVRAMIHPLNPPRCRSMNGEKLNTPLFSDRFMLAEGAHNLCQTFFRWASAGKSTANEMKYLTIHKIRLQFAQKRICANAFRTKFVRKMKSVSPRPPKFFQNEMAFMATAPHSAQMKKCYDPLQDRNFRPCRILPPMNPFSTCPPPFATTA